MGERQAVVVGAGIGGLTAALALHRRGWQVRVFERAPRLEPVGAGISLWPNALRALDTLGLGEPLRSVAAVTGPAGVRRPSGRWLARTDAGSAIQARFGDPLVVVHRADLVDLIVGELPAGTVRTGTVVTEVRTGADRARAGVRTSGVGPDPVAGAGADSTAGTAAGATVDIDADLVVGADGIRSGVRGVLHPDHPGPRYVGYTAWRMVVPFVEGPSFETWGRDGQRFAAVPMNGGRLYCYATANAPAGVTYPDDVAELARRFGEWHDPIPRIIARLTAVLHQDIEELPVPLPSLHRGRTALIGDAAHAMTPDLGQGGCMAIEDAVVLAAVLDDGPVPEALAGYDAARLERTTAVATRSHRAGRMYQAPYLVQGVAARLMGLVPNTAIAHGLAPVIAWQPPRPADPERARD